MAGIDDIFNVQSPSIEPPVLIDESSATEYYVGTSRSYITPSDANWRVKRIWKVGHVWKSGFPNGNQGFEYIWDNRYDYTYS